MSNQKTSTRLPSGMHRKRSTRLMQDFVDSGCVDEDVMGPRVGFQPYCFVTLRLPLRCVYNSWLDGWILDS